MPDELLTIREMTEKFGVTPRTLRFYESSELLSPLRKGQTRLYTRADRGRLKLILRGRRFGFTLMQIREILDLYNPADKNRAQTEIALATARERLADMEQQSAELELAIVELRDQIKEGEAWLARSRQEHVAAND